jgi:long-chain acyl-CoA synthetase
MEYGNLARLMRLQAERLGPRVAVRHKRHGLYRGVTWGQYHAEVRAAAAALVQAGVAPGDRVALVGENSLDWLVADLAVLTAGAVTVSPHAPLTARQVHYQLHDADCVWAFVSDRRQLDKLLCVRGELPGLRGLVVFDARAGGATPWEAFKQEGRRVLPAAGGELARREEALGPDALATVMYTSGTTGNPKGVMLTHGNLLSNALACLRVQPHGPDDVVLGWLPYTHIYARLVDHYTTLAAGVTLALADSAETVVENLGEVGPTHVAGVPRFYEKVLAAVGCDDPAETGRRLRRLFGGRIDWLSSGGAPLGRGTAAAYHDAGLLLLQGYGLTESSPVISFNSKAHHKLGTVGRPLPGVGVRIAADGEVLTRGPHVMRGYWKNPQATAEVLRDGWLYTGDLGSLDAEGFLSITGRKKELLVLSNGKKVAPGNLEGLLLADPCIDQAVVCGEGRSFLTALLVPNWAGVRPALAAEGVALAGGPDEMAADPRVRAFLLRRCAAALADLSHAEQVKNCVVVARPFSIENEELTVSLKVRRAVVLGRHGEALERLYRGAADEADGEPEA